MSDKTLKIPRSLFRSAMMDEVQNGEKKSKRISISSDVPYLRTDWDGDQYYEVLSHDNADMDLSRVKAGLPILFNHKRDAHLGRATTFNNDGHRMDVGNMDDIIWSESQDAQDKKKDVENGSLVGTSVGYSILDDGTCIGEKDGIPIYKFKWGAHEFSFCTIEADTTVGAGRSKSEDADWQQILIRDNSLDNPQEKLITKTTSKNLMPETTVEEAPKINVIEEQKKAVSDFKGRCAKINNYIDGLKKPQWKEAAREVAKKHLEGDADFDAFRTEALDKFDDVTRVATEDLNPEIGMSGKELKSYSLARAIHSIGTRKPLTGIEKEASEATAKRLGKDPDGFFIPEDYSNRSLQQIHGISQRNLTAGNFASAGALIATDLLAGSLIELLRNKQVFANLGTTNLGGLVGNVAIPRQSGGATAYWLAEGASVTESDQTFQQVGLTPHRLVAQTAYDKQLVAQASIGVEAMVRNDIALQTSLKKDLAILTGSGANGEPLGILNTTGVQTVTFSTAATWAKVVEFETDLATANADQTGIPVFVTSPAVRGKWKTILKASGALVQSSSFLWDMDMVNGYRGTVSNQVASATNLVYFGVPSEIIDATWAGIDVVVNPFSLDSTGQIRCTVTQWTDIALRHGPAWIVSTDSGAQ